MNGNLLREIVENIVEAADEIRAKRLEDRDSVEQGQLIAYAESLCIIQVHFRGMIWGPWVWTLMLTSGICFRWWR